MRMSNTQNFTAAQAAMVTQAVTTTDATGLYEGALADAADETAWFSATSAPGGFANAAEGCVVVECVPNDATWAA